MIYRKEKYNYLHKIRYNMNFEFVFFKATLHTTISKYLNLCKLKRECALQWTTL